MAFLSNLAAFWNLVLLIGVIGTLVWFCYWVVLRRIMRARRITHARDRRMLKEAAEREIESQRP